MGSAPMGSLQTEVAGVGAEAGEGGGREGGGIGMWGKGNGGRAGEGSARSSTGVKINVQVHLLLFV